MGKVRLAIVGVGNCASSLVQGLEYYKDAEDTARVPGLMHVRFGPYHVRDVEVVAAFDAGLFAEGAFSFYYGYAAKAFPCVASGEPLDVVALPVAADFVSAMAFVGFFKAGEAAFFNLGVEEGFDFLVGEAVVFFEAEEVLGVGFDNFFGDVFLAAHGVDAYDAVC